MSWKDPPGLKESESAIHGDPQAGPGGARRARLRRPRPRRPCRPDLTRALPPAGAAGAARWRGGAGRGGSAPCTSRAACRRCRTRRPAPPGPAHRPTGRPGLAASRPGPTWPGTPWRPRERRHCQCIQPRHQRERHIKCARRNPSQPVIPFSHSPALPLLAAAYHRCIARSGPGETDAEPGH